MACIENRFFEHQEGCRTADVLWGFWQVDTLLRVLAFLLQVLLVTNFIKTMGGRKDVTDYGREQFWHT